MKRIFIVWLITCSFAHANVIPSAAHVYVEGYAEQKVTPDKLTVSINIRHNALDAAEANKNVDQRSLKLFQALQSLEIPITDIKSSPLQINPHYEYKDGERINKGTEVSRNIDIILRDINRYQKLNETLVDSGISQKLDAVAELNDDSKVKQSVLMEALKDAKQKAQKLASINGKKIKDVYSISEFQTREDNSYNLKPTQGVYGQSSSASVQTRQRVPPPPPGGIFEIGEMTAVATIYVVYTIE
jgi:hypothetical protein